LRVDGLPLEGELEAILLHAPIERTATQTKRFSSLAYVALKALKSFPNEQRLHSFQAELLEILRLRTLHVQAQIGRLNFAASAHEHRALERVFEFADISRPGILRHRLKSGRLEAIDFAPITGSVPPQKMDGKGRNILAPLA
jgi:hypothetical protein